MRCEGQFGLYPERRLVNELDNVELARVQSLRGAFVPIEVAGNLTPESDEGGHLTEASEEGPEEEGNDREETSL